MANDIEEALYERQLGYRAFMVSDIQELTDGGSITIHLNNPSDSDVRIWVTSLHATGTNDLRVDIHHTFTSAPSGGDDATVHKIILEDGGPFYQSNVEAAIGPSFTSDGMHEVGVAGGGPAGGGGSEDHPAVVLEQGREVVFEVTNISTMTAFYGLHLVFFEERRD